MVEMNMQGHPAWVPFYSAPFLSRLRLSTFRLRGSPLRYVAPNGGKKLHTGTGQLPAPSG